MDHPVIPHLTTVQWGSLITMVVVGLFASAYILRTCLRIFNEEMPTFRRAMFIVPAVAFGAYIAFDLFSYLVLLAFKDSIVFRRTVFGDPRFGFVLWLQTALPIKWAVISAIPMLGFWIRNSMLFMVVAVAGVLQVFFLTIPFRKAVMIFGLQWLVNLIVYFMVANALHFGGGILEHKTSLHADFSHYEKITDEKGGELKDKASEIIHNIEDNKDLKELEAKADHVLKDLKESLKPVTDHLPAPVNNFLEKGGWWLVLGFLLTIFIFWVRAMYFKIKRAFRKGNSEKKKRLISSDKWIAGELVEDLALMTAPINRPGKNRITIKGLPARIYLIIMAKAGGSGPDLNESQFETILDYILPGLGSVGVRDFPRIKIWEPQYSPEGFNSMFSQNIRIPDPKGTKSKWILVSGAVKMGQDKVYLGLAFSADEANLVRSVLINQDQWLDVLRIETLG